MAAAEASVVQYRGMYESQTTTAKIEVSKFLQSILPAVVAEMKAFVQHQIKAEYHLISALDAADRRN